VLAACPAAATTEVEDVDSGPPGVLAAGLTTDTTEDEDIDGGPPWWVPRQVQQQPPLKLKTSMTGPLGVLAAGPIAGTTNAKKTSMADPRAGR
jgi:hypothetical protein